jgi:hypothetical protein
MEGKFHFAPPPFLSTVRAVPYASANRSYADSKVLRHGDFLLYETAQSFILKTQRSYRDTVSLTANSYTRMRKALSMNKQEQNASS